MTRLMTINSISIIILATFLLFPNDSKAISKHISTISNPEPVKRVEPRYPVNAARNHQEGWVKLSYVIEKDGHVSNVLVTETSGSSDFAKAAKKSVKKWKYSPAFENGQPIQQCTNEVKIEFRMQNQGQSGVSTRFKHLYKKAETALIKQDYAETERVIKDLFQLKKRHLSESDYLHLLGFEYARAINDKELQLHHLYRISFDTGASKQHKMFAYKHQFNLEIELNKFFNAKLTYQKMSKLKEAEPIQEQLNAIMQQIEDNIGSDGHFIVKANMNTREHWHHTLVRNKFSITDIEGDLNKIDIRCSNMHHIYTIEKENAWVIPESWKNCHIYVYGEDNTKFNLVELPSNS